MGFWDKLFGGKKKKVLAEFGGTVDELVAIPFQDQARLSKMINQVKGDITGSDEKDAEIKVGALIERSKTLRAQGKGDENLLNVRKVYLALVALEDSYPAAFQTCRDIEKFIQG